MTNVQALIEQLVDARVRALLAEHHCSPPGGRTRAGAPPRTAYSVPEVAKSIGFSTRYVYQLIGTGELRSIRAGRRVVVPVEALAEYIAAAPSGAS